MEEDRVTRICHLLQFSEVKSDLTHERFARAVDKQKKGFELNLNAILHWMAESH